MSSKEIVTKLLLDDKDFSGKLDKAKKSAQSYHRDMESLGRSVGSSVTKSFTALAGAVGLAAGGMETFKKYINATNYGGDAWNATLRGMTNTVGTFFASLRSGDFTSFAQGLSLIAEKGREAYRALDALGNATMSYNYFNNKNQADFAEQIAAMRDTGASADTRVAARNTAEQILGSQKEISDELRRKVMSAVQALSTESNLLSSEDIGLADIDMVLRLDISADGEAAKAELEKSYEQFLRELSAIKPVDWSYVPSGMVNGMPVMTKVESQEDRARYDTEVHDVALKYKDAVLYNTILAKQSDEWLNNLISLVGQADQADRMYASMEKTLIRAGSSVDKIATGMQKAATSAASIETGPDWDKLANFNRRQQLLSWGTIGGKDLYSGPIHDITVPEEETEAEALPSLSKTNTQLSDTAKGADAAADAVSSLGSAFSSLSGIVGDSAAAWMDWAASMASAVAQAIPAIATLVASHKAEATASAEAAAAGGAAAVASTPVVGPAMAVAAVASIVAALASIPKFATGGIVPGSSYSGDNVLARVNSGEMVLTREQQAILGRNLSGQSEGNVRFEIDGTRLVGVLNNFNRHSQRRV